MKLRKVCFYLLLILGIYFLGNKNILLKYMNLKKAMSGTYKAMSGTSLSVLREKMKDILGLYGCGHSRQTTSITDETLY